MTYIFDLFHILNKSDNNNKNENNNKNNNNNNLVSLTEWLSVWLQTKWFWVPTLLLSLEFQISHLFRARSSFEGHSDNVDNVYLL